MRSLRGLRLLIVEDEVPLAHDLARHFRTVGAKVIGPAATLALAYRLLPGVEAAILDIRLNGSAVFPFADALDSQSIPFVFFTGHDAADIPARFRFASRLRKPSRLCGFTQSVMDCTDLFPAGTDIVTILPKLRLTARLLLHDAGAADRLVERTLQQAITAGVWPNDVSVAEWLNSVMTAQLRTGSFLH